MKNCQIACKIASNIDKEEGSMKKQSEIKIVQVVLFLICLFWGILFIGNTPVHAGTTINFPTGASRYGNDVYYALEYLTAPAGNIRKYNIKTNKNTLVLKGKYVQIIADKEYLYATENLGVDADSQSYSIYRMSKNGKNRKLLDHGSDPIKVGNYIYYLKMSKYEGKYQKNVGIYRMTISGTKRKCIMKLPSHSLTDLYYLGYANGRLYFTGDGSTWYSISKSGSNFKKVNINNYATNQNGGIRCNGWSFETEQGSTNRLYGRTLYAKKAGQTKKMISTSITDYFSVIQLKDRIIVRITQSSHSSVGGLWQYYYIMKPDGSDKHYVCKAVRGG